MNFNFKLNNVLPRHRYVLSEIIFIHKTFLKIFFIENLYLNNLHLNDNKLIYVYLRINSNGT